MSRKEESGAIGRTFCNVANTRRFTHTASEDIFEHQDWLLWNYLQFEKSAAFFQLPLLLER